jgi:hypothetical protein
MCNESDIQATVITLKPSPNIFSTKTVAYTAELFDFKFVSCVLDRCVDHGFNGGLGMQCDPFSKVEACFLLLDTYWVPSKKIRDEYEVAIAGYGVCESARSVRIPGLDCQITYSLFCSSGTPNISVR